MENINDYMPLSNDWNKERLETLKKMFPDLFTNEGKLNINELKKVVDPESVSETERYEFRWFGKSAAKRKAFSPSNATLIFDEKRSVNATETDNLIIEGENLEVLKLLSTAYREKVKCIYIDPPYNTGKDFVYSDNYSQDKKGYWEDAGVTEEGLKIDTNTETDGRYHSNWLNMMYSRLLIARQLLREDGVIFISIDDNENHHLRKLCDEVFGEENFEANIIPIVNPGGRDYKQVAITNEYILVYSKSELTEFNELPKEAEFQFTDSNGGYNLRELRNRNPKFHSGNRPNLFYAFYVNPNNCNAEYCSVSLTKDSQHTIEVRPYNSEGKESVWRWGKEKAEKNIVLNDLDLSQIVAKQKSDGNWNIYEKNRRDTTKAKSVWDETEMRTENGTRSFRELFSASYFDHPKSVDLVKRCIQIGSSDGDLVLDFFGGSGTMGQAVFELSKVNGQRNFIIIQIPESTEPKSEAFKAGYKKISDITIERNRRVVERFIEEKKKEQPDLFTNGHKKDAIKGLGFKVFKLVKSNFPRVEFAPDPEKTTEENIELLKKYIRDKEAQLITAFNRDELVTEILIKNGFTLNYTLTKQEEFKKNEIFFATDGEKETLICLDISIDMETVEHFKKHNTQKFICLERALDTTKKWNLKHYLGDKFNAF
ncbi:MAG: site-specific DNA-methyltransferase [Bacteroidia bacterium]|jgi:adenine-specific DNA-methyltransferase|nr:site-specific DNA-methyltransferase [Bacteroidota bacterium]MCZ2129008.1 site-specific DNA-methyltransferase [Bacteroidia bacterium]